MNFFKKHSLLLINISFVSIIIFWVFYVKILFSESKKNFTEIKNYSKWLLDNESDISFNNKKLDNFNLKINWESFYKWNTINKFHKKLKELEQNNWKKKILINIYNWNKIIKTEIFKYSDFWYSININSILNQVKLWIIRSKKEIDIKLKDFLFFDNKLLNKKVNSIKESFIESNNWEIYYSKETKSFKVNSNKAFLSSIKEIKLDIIKIDKNVTLKDSFINIYLDQKENILFEQAKNLNKTINKIKEITFEVDSSLEWFNFNKIKKSIQNLEIKKISILQDREKFKILFSKGFILDYITYNQKLNIIELDEELFDKTYKNLSKINLENIPDKIIEKPSLYSISYGWVSENKPNETNFKVLSYGNGINFDYESFKKELKIFVDKIETNKIQDSSIKLKWLFIKNSKKDLHKIKLKNQDSSYVSKSLFNLKQWFYKNNDYLTEKYINYSIYPFRNIKLSTGYNSCLIKNNIELYCEEWKEPIWELWYDSWNIILKKPNASLYNFSSNKDYWISRQNWNLRFIKEKVVIYYWNLYNNLKINM